MIFPCVERLVSAAPDDRSNVAIAMLNYIVCWPVDVVEFRLRSEPSS